MPKKNNKKRGKPNPTEQPKELPIDILADPWHLFDSSGDEEKAGTKEPIKTQAQLEAEAWSLFDSDSEQKDIIKKKKKKKKKTLRQVQDQVDPEIEAKGSGQEEIDTKIPLVEHQSQAEVQQHMQDQILREETGAWTLQSNVKRKKQKSFNPHKHPQRTLPHPGNVVQAQTQSPSAPTTQRQLQLPTTHRNSSQEITLTTSSPAVPTSTLPLKLKRAAVPTQKQGAWNIPLPDNSPAIEADNKITYQQFKLLVERFNTMQEQLRLQQRQLDQQQEMLKAQQRLLEQIHASPTQNTSHASFAATTIAIETTNDAANVKTDADMADTKTKSTGTTARSKRATHPKEPSEPAQHLADTNQTVNEGAPAMTDDAWGLFDSSDSEAEQTKSIQKGKPIKSAEPIEYAVGKVEPREKPRHMVGRILSLLSGGDTQINKGKCPKSADLEKFASRAATLSAPSQAECTVNLRAVERMNFWALCPPVHMGPVALFKKPGSGRGFLAPFRISAGTVLLSELPFATWPEDNKDGQTPWAGVKGLLVMAASIPAVPAGEQQNSTSMKAISEGISMVLKEVSHLHPVNLSDVPPDVLQRVKEDNAKDIKIFLEEWSELSELTEEVLLRLLLVYQYNAFASGLYLHLSIFNHSCNPNCIKLSPTQQGEPSVVRALRHIQPGEELTISYIDTHEQSVPKRHYDLRSFDFRCECSRCRLELGLMDDMILMAGGTNSEMQVGKGIKQVSRRVSTRRDDPHGQVWIASGLCRQCHPQKAADNDRLEKQLLQWEQQMDDSSLQISNFGMDGKEGQELAKKAIESLKRRLEEASAILHPDHVLLSRIQKQLIDLYSFLLSTSPYASSQSISAAFTSTGGIDTFVEYSVAMLKCLVHVYKYQSQTLSEGM